MRALPLEVAAAEPAVVRPRDLTGVWARPAKELAALAADRLLLRLAYGYYAIVPEASRGRVWHAPVEAAGVAIGQVDYGRDQAVVMGPAAVRLLGLLPRALGTATVAVPKQRPALDTAVGRVRFVTRDVDRLDAQWTATPLGRALVTTPEQTLLDLLDRPRLGGLATADLVDAVAAVADAADLDAAAALAEGQSKRRAGRRLRHGATSGDWTAAVTVA